MIVRLLTLLCFCFFTQLTFAEMPVEIKSTTPDSVGQRLVFALKESIRSSTSLGISFDQSKPRMQVNIVTLDQNTTDSGYSTAYAMVILWNNPAAPFPFYLTHIVGYCGTSRVRECADNLIAHISEQADSLLKLFQAASNH